VTLLPAVLGYDPRRLAVCKGLTHSPLSLHSNLDTRTRFAGGLSSFDSDSAAGDDDFIAMAILLVFRW
jgi:hypothetical protein